MLALFVLNAGCRRLKAAMCSGEVVVSVTPPARPALRPTRRRPTLYIGIW